MTDPLPSKVQEVIDRMEILQCIHRLARGMDRHDEALMASCYHPDAIDEQGDFLGDASAFIARVNGTSDTVGRHEQKFVDHLHHLTNHVCDLDGDTAHSETYYVMIAKHRSSDGLGVWSGRYIDRLERREGRWAITVRRVAMSFATDLPNEGGHAEYIKNFFPGTWDRSDPSYDRPLNVPATVR